MSVKRGRVLIISRTHRLRSKFHRGIVHGCLELVANALKVCEMHARSLTYHAMHADDHEFSKSLHNPDNQIAKFENDPCTKKSFKYLAHAPHNSRSISPELASENLNKPVTCARYNIVVSQNWT